MMTNDITVLEHELRELVATIPPPPAPASWRRDDSAARAVPALRLPGRRHWIAWRVAVTTALAVAVTAVFVLLHRDTSVAAITVYALPAAWELSCSLPISALSNDRTTGFVVLDHGRATFQPVQTDGTTYVPALARWINVLPQMVAPDGRSYVTQGFSSGTTTIHVVDATADRTVLKTDAPVNVFGFSPQGILLIDMSRAPGPPGPGARLNLKLLDPASGALHPFPYPPPSFESVREVGASSSASYSRNANAIWLTAYNPTTNSTTISRYGLPPRRRGRQRSALPVDMVPWASPL